MRQKVFEQVSEAGGLGLVPSPIIPKTFIVIAACLASYLLSMDRCKGKLHIWCCHQFATHVASLYESSCVALSTEQVEMDAWRLFIMLQNKYKANKMKLHFFLVLQYSLMFQSAACLIVLMYSVISCEQWSTKTDNKKQNIPFWSSHNWIYSTLNCQCQNHFLHILAVWSIVWISNFILLFYYFYWLKFLMSSNNCLHFLHLSHLFYAFCRSSLLFS